MSSKSAFHRSVLLAGAAVLFASAVSASADNKVITEWDLQTTTGAVKVIRDAADRFEAANPGYKAEDLPVGGTLKIPAKS